MSAFPRKPVAAARHESATDRVTWLAACRDCGTRLGPAWSDVPVPIQSAEVDAQDFQFVVSSIGLRVRGVSDQMCLLDGDDSVSILTGAQWGLVAVSAEHFDVEPGDVSDDWEDVVEVSVESTDRLSVAPLSDAPVLSWIGQGGSFRMRISARGRDLGAGRGYDELDQDVPVEHYLIQTWPAPPAAPAVIRLTSDHAAGRSQFPDPPATLAEQAAGRAAGQLIARDIATDAPPLTQPQGGEARASGRLTGSRRSLFPLLARHCGLWGSSYIWGGAFPTEPGFSLDVSCLHPDEPDGDAMPGPGCVRLTYREVHSPARAVVAWNWHSNPGQFTPQHEWPPVLAHDTSVELDLTQGRGDDGTVYTDVQVTHRGLPNTWVQPMAQWWAWRLARTEQARAATR